MTYSVSIKQSAAKALAKIAHEDQLRIIGAIDELKANPDSLSRARPLRRECAGALDHVTSHGDRREVILFGDDDRREWLEVVGTVGSRFKGEPYSAWWRACGLLTQPKAFTFRVSVTSPDPVPDVSRLSGDGRGWPNPTYST